MKAWLLIFLSLGTLFACNANRNPQDNNTTKEVGVVAIDVNKSEEPSDEASAIMVDSAAPPASAGNTDPVFESGNQLTEPKVKRQLIKTAYLHMECDDFETFAASVNGIISLHGGWVDSEHETQSDYQRQNVVQVKVPVAKFDALMQGLVGLDGKLLEKKIESEDVTNAIIDTRGRIEAKKLIRARYLELLKQATSMQDILEVQREINSITEDMESAAYNLQHMQAQAAFSTVHFTYSQPLEGSIGTEQSNFFSRLWEAVKDGGSGIQNMIIVLAALWPLWLLLGLVFIGWKRRRKAVAKAVAPNLGRV